MIDLRLPSGPPAVCADISTKHIVSVAPTNNETWRRFGAWRELSHHTRTALKTRLASWASHRDAHGWVGVMTRNSSPHACQRNPAERFGLWQRSHRGTWPNQSASACSLGIQIPRVREFDEYSTELLRSGIDRLVEHAARPVGASQDVTRCAQLAPAGTGTTTLIRLLRKHAPRFPHHSHAATASQLHSAGANCFVITHAPGPCGQACQRVQL